MIDNLLLQASVDSDKGINGQSIKSGKIFYRCNFPTDLCGRLIGKYGKNINYIKEKTGANVALNTNPFTPDYQLCSIDGKRKTENLLFARIYSLTL